MQQMILPQASTSGAPQDPGATKPGSNRDAGGDTRFDEVSRAERKRLDQRQADRQDLSRAIQDKRDARRADRKDSADGAEPLSSSKPGQSGASETRSREARADHASAAQDDQAPTDYVPMTFASLQSLLTPVGNDLPPADADQAMNPARLPVLNLPGAINGQAGQQNSTGAGLTPGAQLTDLLSAGLAGESARPVDPASVLSTPRFQSALEVASQQAAQLSRLAPEAALPLRGYATSVEVPVGQAEWGDKVMGKLSWLTARNMSVAEIHLTPPDMGPMEVKVRMQNEQANITVHAANPVVREQLELNSHRLRDMLGEQGLSLGQFDVSDQPGRQTGEQGDGSGEGAAAAGSGSLAGTEADDIPPELNSLDLGWTGEVDVFV